jgi:hypothetical protein
MSQQPEMSQQSEMTLQQELMKLTNNKNKVFVPPIRYELMPQTEHETLSNIYILTNGFCNLPKNLVDWICYDVRSRPVTYFGRITAPPSASLNKQIIGFEGCYLKLTTQNTGVNFIWYDNSRNEYHFWGEYSRCIRAMNEIRYRICKFVDKTVASMSLPTTPLPMEMIFENDINPHPAVIMEAHFTCNENGDILNSVSKIYPDSDAKE